MGEIHFQLVRRVRDGKGSLLPAGAPDRYRRAVLSWAAPGSAEEPGHPSAPTGSGDTWQWVHTCKRKG